MGGEDTSVSSSSVGVKAARHHWRRVIPLDVVRRERTLVLALDDTPSSYPAWHVLCSPDRVEDCSG
jgi:hypothetical protein